MENEASIDPELLKTLAQEGYFIFVLIPNRGVCAVCRMLYTAALCYGLDDGGYEGRYCYETMSEAAHDLIRWDGVGDPAGDWIKHKGRTEYSNPNYTKS